MSLASEFSSVYGQYAEACKELKQAVKFVSEAPLNRFHRVSGLESNYPFADVASEFMSLSSLVKCPLHLVSETNGVDAYSALDEAKNNSGADGVETRIQRILQVEFENTSKLLSKLAKQCETVQDLSRDVVSTESCSEACDDEPCVNANSLVELCEAVRRLRRRVNDVNSQAAYVGYVLGDLENQETYA